MDFVTLEVRTDKLHRSIGIKTIYDTEQSINVNISTIYQAQTSTAEPVVVSCSQSDFNGIFFRR
jgi:hypothetical protein